MTNVSASPEKVSIRKALFDGAITALEAEDYRVERIPRSGKSSVRKITRNGESSTVSIRTTQDTWIAFPRNEDDSGWATLEDVDYVVASSVSDRDDPKAGNVHMIPAAEMKARFDRAYTARLNAGHSVPVGRGVWISLYEQEASDPVSLIGAGAGLQFPPIARFPLTAADAIQPADSQEPSRTELLTIPEAKRRLALTFGVKEADISITING